MPDLNNLVREYCEILDQERNLGARKEQLRQAILQEMQLQNLAGSRSPYGSAQRTTRFKLHPRRDEVLGLLNSEDLLPFASFAPEKVKTVLVPKYGRERLLPLFDIERIESLVVRRPPRPGNDRGGPSSFRTMTDE
jgi:hypothetical protein